MARLISPNFPFLDTDGTVNSSGFLYFYESGSSTTAKTTYSDVAETIALPNPVPLDALGRAPNVFGTGSYRMIVQNSDAVQTGYVDPIGGDGGVAFGADWVATQTYSETDVVRDAGIYWISQAAGNIGNQPSVDGGTNWLQYPQINTINIVDPVSSFYTDSGTANTYVLTAGSKTPTPDAYFDGYRIEFAPSNPNTGACTVNPAGLGVKNLKDRLGNVLPSGAISTHLVQAEYNSTAGEFWLIEDVSILSSREVRGLALSNGTDTVNDIDIAAGSALDSTDAYLLTLPTVITKQIDAVWAVGDDAGGLDAGTVANDTWYYVHLIKRLDTGVVDALFSLSKTAPTLPTDYDIFRCLGAILFGTATIEQFYQVGDQFMWLVSSEDYAATNPGTSAVLATLSVPPEAEAVIDFRTKNSTGSSAAFHRLSETSQTDVVPTTSNATTNTVGGGPARSSVRTIIRADSSSQVRHRSDFSSASIEVNVITEGWYDDRGAK